MIKRILGLTLFIGLLTLLFGGDESDSFVDYEDWNE